MAKTKTTRKPARRKAAPEIAAPAPMHAHHYGDGWPACSNHLCFLCWIFKIMIIVFLIMLVFWLGFCFGGGTPEQGKGCFKGYKGDCSRAGQMSQTMSMRSMEQMMADMTAALNGKSGEELDKEFLIQMIVHHEGAVEMARQIVGRSTNEELKAFAQKIIDTQTEEISRMKTWQAQPVNY